MEFFSVLSRWFCKENMVEIMWNGCPALPFRQILMYILSSLLGHELIFLLFFFLQIRIYISSFHIPAKWVFTPYIKVYTRTALRRYEKVFFAYIKVLLLF
jgi:hypothetical protein